MAGVRMQALEFVEQARNKALKIGWHHTNTNILEMQGRLASQPFVDYFAEHVLPSMGNLYGRLNNESLRFLEVGCGTGQMAVAMASRWKKLVSVALEPWKPSADAARQRIAQHHFDDRVTIVEKGIEAYDDHESTFDFAWIASDFVPEKILPSALQRIHSKLHPGGWLWLIGVNATDPLRRAVTALRSTWWGGGSPDSETLSALLEEAHYVNIKEVAKSSSGDFVYIVAQRSL